MIEREKESFIFTPYYSGNTGKLVVSEKSYEANSGTAIRVNKNDLKYGLIDVSLIQNSDILYYSRIKNSHPRTSLVTRLSHRNVNQRENISLSIEAFEEPAYLTVSVRKKEAYENRSHYLETWYDEAVWTSGKDNTTDPYLPNNGYLPEIRGHVIRGKIIDGSGNGMANQDVALSVISDNPQFQHFQTDQYGEFIFSGIKPSESDEVILSSSSRREFTFELDSGFLKDHQFVHTRPFKIREEWKEAIRQHSVYLQLYNSYFEFNQDSVISSPPGSYFYGEPSTTYYLNDYTQFPTMEEVITEYVKELGVRKSKGVARLSLNLFISSLNKGDSILLLINGTRVYNPQNILDLNPTDVERIEIVYQDYVYGQINATGIANFITFDNSPKHLLKDARYSLLEVGGIEKKRIIRKPEHSASNEQNSRLPDLRRDLLWEPFIVLDDEDQTFNFYTSDLSGEFEVLIMGYTKSGELILRREAFTVN